MLYCEEVLTHFWILCRNRFIFVNTDACMAAQGVTLGVMEKLKVDRNLLDQGFRLDRLQSLYYNV